ncbi:hypothetical protein [Alicyclobacillus mengziensis]|uniref:Uncharacterized protein n=1 Tax=Alicyclobacillus mengziensis TaxID=2931921 RepID=A0A9X7VW79_9BACL|nr:hypothetical protein [Alicyclobacillus mengziensis]QSO46221.1 hypothetical protein JZ786_17150 [Alicyclobacillus mengziensis]
MTKTRAQAEESLRCIRDGDESGCSLLAMCHRQNRRLVGYAGLVRQKVDGKSEI